MNQIYDDIRKERERQDAMFAEVNAKIDPFDYHWMSVICKTFGDANATLLFMKRGGSIDVSGIADLRKNLIQVAASAVQMIEKIDQANLLQSPDSRL